MVTKHHVATHIINVAARKVLGSHVWQHSAFKDVDKARLDITHFESLSEDEVEKIEKIANEIVEKGLPIKVEILSRSEAEKKYGFTIYQGGAIPEKILRIVSIGNVDVEACGGTHYLLKSTKDVGCILILKSKRIQDGIDRIEFAAGEVALNYLKEKEEILKEVAEKLEVKKTEVPKAVEELFKEWKQKRKQLRKK
jgi:alanyl-tRNA synthetase